MEKNSLESQLEALLYLFGDPVKIKKLTDILEVKTPELKTAIASLKESLEDKSRGLTIVEHGGAVQLVTKSEFSKLLQEIAKEDLDTTLSPASMETLSIITYLGPCRRSFIDYIRGVNSSYILRNLMIRGLVEREVDKKRANTFTYNVSFDFLRHMGVSDVKDLPSYGEYREFVEKFKGEENNETND